MTWPASTQSLFNTFMMASNTIVKTAQSIRSLRDNSVGSNTDRKLLLSAATMLSQSISTLNTLAATPGIVQYARDQFNDPALDVAAEFTAMVSSATDLRDWIVANFPKDAGTGAVLMEVLNANGTRTPLVFTSAQLAGFRNQADLFLATID